MNRSLLLVLAGAAAVVVLFFVFRSGDDESSPPATTTTTTPAATTSTKATSTVPGAGVVIVIAIKHARPVGGIQHAVVKQGDKVSLSVTSDTRDEVHLHGYDLSADIEDGKAQIDFTATIAGRFEAELEDHGVQILDLEVTP